MYFTEFFWICFCFLTEPEPSRRPRDQSENKIAVAIVLRSKQNVTDMLEICTFLTQTLERPLTNSLYSIERVSVYTCNNFCIVARGIKLYQTKRTAVNFVKLVISNQINGNYNIR